MSRRKRKYVHIKRKRTKQYVARGEWWSIYLCWQLLAISQLDAAAVYTFTGWLKHKCTLLDNVFDYNMYQVKTLKSNFIDKNRKKRSCTREGKLLTANHFRYLLSGEGGKKTWKCTILFNRILQEWCWDYLQMKQQIEKVWPRKEILLCVSRIRKVTENLIDEGTWLDKSCISSQGVQCEDRQRIYSRCTDGGGAGGM